MDANIVPPELDKIFVQKIQDAAITSKKISLDVLRLDEMHPVVSGNKWFKLQHYLRDAIEQKKTTIATFGGAFSNHIIATAFACKQYKLRCIGFIRGDESAQSHTLDYAASLGMELQFIAREDYRNKDQIKTSINNDWYWIAEGGYGQPGADGAASIIEYADNTKYDFIIAGVGTGTMLAGLIAASTTPVIGISSMKGNTGLEDAVRKLLPRDKLSTPFSILHDYHFGGYAKHPPQLLAFINQIYLEHKLPLDIVYTGKVFYAITDLTLKDYFKPGARLLMIHSGGLQGNQSLPPGLLSFL